VFHGTNGASLRIDYSVAVGFCGVWNSLLGKASYPQHSLNFTNLYGSLRNSSANPSRVENIQVTNFSFWARGDGKGEFDHNVKVESRTPAASPPPPTSSFPTDQLGPVRFSAQQLRNAGSFPRQGSRVRRGRLAKPGTAPEVFIWMISPSPPMNRLTILCNGTTTPGSNWISHRAFSYFLQFTDDLGFALDRSTFPTW